MFRFNWKPTAPAVLEREQVMVLIYNIEQGVQFGKVYGNTLSQGEQLVKVHLFKGGTTVHCYFAVLATDRSNQSDSVYLGKFEIGTINPIPFDGSAHLLIIKFPNLLIFKFAI